MQIRSSLQCTGKPGRRGCEDARPDAGEELRGTAEQSAAGIDIGETVM